jgi:hypothetical protein
MERILRTGSPREIGGDLRTIADEIHSLDPKARWDLGNILESRVYCERPSLPIGNAPLFAECATVAPIGAVIWLRQFTNNLSRIVGWNPKSVSARGWMWMATAIVNELTRQISRR